MKPDLQLAHLKALVTIHETGSFAAAAAALGRSQSAITQQMQLLEQAVGTPLFFANGRRRELTEAGRTLLRHAQEILSLCKHALSSTERSHNAGTIRFGAPLELANDLVPAVLREFSRSWPAMRIALTVDRSRTLMEMLEEGALDLALSTWRSGSREGVLARLLQVHWIAAKDWQLRPEEPLPLVLTDAPSMFRRICLNALELNGWNHYERFTTANPAGIRLAIEAGIGLTARTLSAFRSNVQILGTGTGLPSLPYVSYYLHRSLIRTSPAIEDLYQCILDQIIPAEPPEGLLIETGDPPDDEGLRGKGKGWSARGRNR